MSTTTRPTTTVQESNDVYLPAASPPSGEAGLVESLVKEALDLIYLESDE